MSGRIRSIKPEWLDDELLALASSDARVLSVALLLLADDFGNGRASTRLLAGRVFPDNFAALEPALQELVTIRYISLYEVDGQRYFSIRNWSKHQKVDKPGRPKVPSPEHTCSVGVPKAELPKVAYFIRGATTGLIKIGESVDPVQRLSELARCGSERLELLAIGGTERELHAELTNDRVHGEWFRPSLRVLEKICEFGGTVNQSSSGIEIQPIATAGYNSGKRLLEKLPEGGLEEVENILEEEENPRASRASISPSLSRSSPVPNQDQPVRSDQAPLRDPLADSLRGHLPYQRSDVGRVFARFSELAKLPNTKLGGYACVRAQLIAESIEQFGEAGCISILDAAKLDDTVNGRGDAAGGIEHWTVEYIFKPATRERLYKAAEERRVAAERREKARARALAKTVASRDEPGFIPKSELAKLAGNIGRAMP